MRLAIMLVMLAGCRNVLGIPGDFDLPGTGGFAVRGTVRGAYGASGPVIVSHTNGETITVVREETFTFSGLGNGPFIVTASDPCTVTNGAGIIEDADVEGIEITCDGLAGLASLGFSAPISLPAPVVPGARAAASLLTQRTTFLPAVIDPAATIVAVRRNGNLLNKTGDVYGPVEVNAGDTFQVQVEHPDIASRTFDIAVDIDNPRSFGYGKATVTNVGDRLGAAIASTETRIVFGIPDRNRVEVHDRDGQTFPAVESLAPLAASNPNDRFGASVAVAGTTVVVGAPGREAVYVFTKTGATWTEQILVASNSEAGDRFGTAVAIAGDRIVVGAPFEDTGAPNSGAAYVFTRSGTTFTETRLLKASNRGADDRFGSVVAISTSAIAVAAPFEDSSAGPTDNLYPDAGAAYVFELPAFGETYVKPAGLGADDRFGESIAITRSTSAQGDFDLLVVGAPREDSGATGIDGSVDETAATAGAAYVFWKPSATTAWTQTGYVKASNTDRNDGFGAAVAIAGRVLAVGAAFEDSKDDRQDNNGAPDAGAVYVYVVDVATGAVSTDPAYLKASNIGAGDAFGSRLSLTGESLVVGAPREDSAATGWGGPANNGAQDAGAIYTFR